MNLLIVQNETYQSLEDVPQKKSDEATGRDVITTSDPNIVGSYIEHEGKKLYSEIDYIEYKTNLYATIENNQSAFSIPTSLQINYDILVFPRSSLSKYKLLLANSIGLIDADYRGEIILRFKYQWQPNDLIIHENKIYGIPDMEKIYKKKDAICQLKITKVENVTIKLVDELNSTTRGEGGFGSTDKPNKSSIEEIYSKVAPDADTPTKYSELIRERVIQ